MHNSKKLIILAQVFISCLMAFMMSGIFSYFHLGFTAQWLQAWGLTFVVAWPLAFILSMIVGPLSFRMAELILTRVSAP